MKNYIKLMRIKHYIKNALIFFPVVFSKNIFSPCVFNVLYGFIAFSLLCSAVYIINDIGDAEKDRAHSVKKNRPIASGAVSVRSAVVFLVILIFTAFIVAYFSFGFSLLPWAIMLIYLLLNLGYSLGLKNIPLVDIAILVSGFLFRVMFGAVIIDVAVSSWLYLTVMSFAFYLSLAKRRNEMKKQVSESTRKVLKYYSYQFLDKNMTVFLSLALGFYSLWCINAFKTRIMVFSIPLLVLIALRYSLIVENDSEGDPVTVVFTDIPLIIMASLFVCLVFSILYFV